MSLKLLKFDKPNLFIIATIFESNENSNAIELMIREADFDETLLNIPKESEKDTFGPLV